MKKNVALWRFNPGTNTSGFSAIPGGTRYSDGRFIGIGDDTYFWSATTENSNPSYAWSRSLNDFNGRVTRNAGTIKSFGASVRCLRDWLFAYLTICGRANAGGEKGGLGGIPPNVSFLVLKSSKINHYGISRRTTSVQKKL